MRDLRGGVDGQEDRESDSQGNNVFLLYIQIIKQHIYMHTIMRLRKKAE